MLGKFILQRMLLNSGITCDSINGLEKNKNGKWFLRRSDIDFNIAHAGDLVVCALTDTGLVGVDVELHRGLDYASFGKSFTVEELSLIKESPDSRRAFFDLWTKKESLLKAWGEGLSIEPHDAVVDQNSGYIRGTTKRGYFRVIPLEGYSCCICTSVPISDSDVQFSAASHY